MKLDFGCGLKLQEGWEGVDYCKIKGVKYVFDLNKNKLPFGSNSIDEAKAKPKSGEYYKYRKQIMDFTGKSSQAVTKKIQRTRSELK